MPSFGVRIGGLPRPRLLDAARSFNSGSERASFSHNRRSRFGITRPFTPWVKGNRGRVRSTRPQHLLNPLLPFQGEGDAQLLARAHLPISPRSPEKGYQFFTWRWLCISRWLQFTQRRLRGAIKLVASVVLLYLSPDCPTFPKARKVASKMLCLGARRQRPCCLPHLTP